MPTSSSIPSPSRATASIGPLPLPSKRWDGARTWTSHRRPRWRCHGGLWCFNSPAVVKAIYGAKVPVITAIGHETDTTLADYAADVRAATPTHAAEMAFFDVREAELDLAALADRAY